MSSKKHISKDKLTRAEKYLDDKIFALTIKDLPLLRNILVEAYFSDFWSLNVQINSKNITNFRYKSTLRAINKIDRVIKENRYE